MSDKPSYIYNVEFTVENIALFNYPPELECPEDLDFLVRFQMKNDVSLELTENEFIDSVNCGEKAMKKVMFTMNEKQLECDPKACITAYKIQCPNKIVPCGCYNISKLHCKFQEIKKKFDCLNKCNEGKCMPSDFVIKELGPLQNCDGNVAGTVHFILHLTCYGPRVSCDLDKSDYYEEYSVDKDEFERIKSCKVKTEKDENECIPACPKEQYEYDEYMAQVNGNSLIVRVTKDQFVTRVYDSTSDSNRDNLTIRGCDQQIDFNFPENFKCCNCKRNFVFCNCQGDSNLTDYQQKTSCSGNSYKNSQAMPVIRGNLKYPSRFEDQSIEFDVQDYCKPLDATEKYRMKNQNSRAVCLQANHDNIHRELNGMVKIPNGIEVCKVGCEDDVDVFIWKIAQKRISSNGKKNEIILEMRTPRGPKIEVSKKETREVQVIEEEFDDMKKVVKKESIGLKNGIVAKNGKDIIKDANPKNLVKSVKKENGTSKKSTVAKTVVAQKKKVTCK